MKWTIEEVKKEMKKNPKVLGVNSYDFKKFSTIKVFVKKGNVSNMLDAISFFVPRSEIKVEDGHGYKLKHNADFVLKFDWEKK